jgi:hypothetical protein
MSSISRLLLLVLVLLPTRLWAEAHSITLLGVSGAGGEKFARALELDLSDTYEIVSGDVYRSTAEALGLRGASAEEVSAVATRLRIDAVIGGAVVGQGRTRHLLVAVREGATGRVVARGRYDLAGRTLPLLRQRVIADLVRALERVQPVRKGASPTHQEPVAETNPSTPAEAEPMPATANAVVEQAGPRPATQAAGVAAGVGPSLLSRTLSFNVPTAPSYRGGTVVGVRVEGAIFPLALSIELAQAHPVLASFGVVASFENIFDFHSTVGSASDGVSSVGTASRWSALFVGRIPLGHGAFAGTLQLETGWQQFNYSHAAPVDVGVPNVSYGAVVAGLGWDRRLGPRWLVHDLRAAYLALLLAGDITDESNYGRASGWGIGASAGVTALPLKWLWVRVRASYDRIALHFGGSGTRFAGSAADQWLGGQLEVGFAL